MDYNFVKGYFSFLPKELQEVLSRELDTADNATYGELSMDYEAPATPPNITLTTAGDWYEITDWNEEGLNHRVNIDISGNCLSPEVTGVYAIQAHLSFDTSKNANLQMGIFRNDVLIHNVHSGRWTAVQGEGKPISIIGLAQLSKDDQLCLKMTSDTNNTVITPYHGGIVVLGIHRP